MKELLSVDPLIAQIIEHEGQRQAHEINLIASENYAPAAVMEATGSKLTNKYAEGYPGKRYYAGCQFVDEAELLAIERCKTLFGAEHVNVQPHAGSQANMAVYFSALQPGDTIMGMSLAEGGHLTHGHKVNFSGTFYHAVQYTVHKDTERLDYDAIELLAAQHKPKLIVVGASAYSRTIDFKRMAEIAHGVNAYLLADIAHIAGLIAAQLHPNPFPHADFVSSTTHKTLRGPRGGLVMCKQEHAERLDKAIMPGLQGGPFMNVIAAKAVAFHLAQQPDFVDYQRQVIANAQAMAHTFKDLGYRIVSDGTDNHLFVLDLRSKNMTGRQAEVALSKAGITISRSCVPFDTEKPWITSGIRIGTPAITTRGMMIQQAQEIAQLIDDILMHHTDDTAIKRRADAVERLCHDFKLGL